MTRRRMRGGLRLAALGWCAIGCSSTPSNGNGAAPDAAIAGIDAASPLDSASGAPDLPGTPLDLAPGPPDLARPVPDLSGPQAVTQLASGQSAPWSIAADDTRVYWTNQGTMAGKFLDGTVMAQPIAGGPAVALARDQANPWFIATDGVNVYWTTVAGTVMAVAVGGGAPTTLAAGQMSPSALATDGQFVYWANHDDGTIAKANVGGGGQPTVIASGQPAPLGIAVTATGVYWIATGTVAKQYVDGAVVRLAPGGAGPMTLASGQHGLTGGIAVNDTDVYFTDGQLAPTGNLLRVPIRGGGAPQSVAVGQPNAYWVAVDRWNVYWSNRGSTGLGYVDGAVSKIPLGGNAPIVVAGMQNGAEGIAINSTALFWVALNDATVMAASPK